jgi:asparagine synthase (glutamine-hydrolysing)
MCGIAGYYRNCEGDLNDSILVRMTDSIAHRGPDGFGHWYSSNRHVGLGHRRLSIIDLTENGAQPMSFLNKYVITFNGEIYNYIEIRSFLQSKGYTFRSDSDTEVILSAFDYWGINCLNEFDGMFSFAIYNQETNELFCARDRFGEKPFYFAFHEGNLIFASEMKALWEYGLPKVKNESMLHNYLAYDLVENPNNQTETFYSNIFKLKSSHYFIYKGDQDINQKKYWTLSITDDSELSMNEVQNQFLELLEGSLKRRLRSDVQVGSSLSGGLDSSSIVALISRNTESNHTFSARFENFKRDEGEFIDIVSKNYNTTHHNIFVNENELINDLDKLIWHQEEPFQSGSIYAQYCVYKEARKNNILVMLDGQGADEFLGGYDKDFKFYLKEINYQKALKTTIINRIKENHGLNINLSKRDLLQLSYPQLYELLAKLKWNFNSSVPKGINSSFHHSKKSKVNPFKEFNSLKEMLSYEMTNQGLEKLLKFADRNSMANSIEVRLPFLNHELVEFTLKQKSSLFLDNGWSKAILRNSMKEILPKEIVWRKDKIGFEAPHEKWTKQKEFIELCNESKLNLIKQQFVTDDYNNNWKSILAAKFLAL